MKLATRLLGAWLTVSAISLSPLEADVKLPAVFSDNMVLQRGMAIPIWGTADAGEKVTVTLGDQSASAVVDRAGRWMVKLKPLDAAGTVALQITGKNTITLKNVLVGEVWICSGQSNMEWRVRNSTDSENEIAAARYPKIRLFQVKKAVAAEPLSETEGAWVECSPETIPDFTAVGYFFGRELHNTLDVPVGLIKTAWGGTPAEAWTSNAMLKTDPDFRPILDRWATILATADQIAQQHEKRVAQWQEAAKKAKADGKPVPRRPRSPVGPNHPHRASGLYNGMIAPLLPFAIKGAIWYQGESNASRAYQYRKLFPAMIRDWRKNWAQGDFPFLFVQLANFRQVVEEPAESDWAELREAQSMTLSLPNTGMAVIIDIGEANNIHPKNKQDVGRRLGLAAGKIAYGRDVVYSGPVMTSITIENDRIRIHFKHVGGGLVAKGGELKGFAIAGPDKKFVWAQAKIENDTVVVQADQVPDPIAVRYAWADNPVCNLYNKEGLPASPFRTDSWPGVTIDAR